jgi:WD40 repeat protein
LLTLTGVSLSVNWVDISDDKTKILTTFYDKTAIIWDAKTGK